MSEADRFEMFVSKRTKRLNVLPPHAEVAPEEAVVALGRFPPWLHRPLPVGGALHQTGAILNQHRLHTVCEEAKCPNLLECWSKKTATFLIMGKACTRNCGFCDIDFTKQPVALDPHEPVRVAASVADLGLRHVVITMVARDDLIDGGSAHLVQVMAAIRARTPDVTLEVLTSDFAGHQQALKDVLQARPEIFNHNIETVRSLTPRVRHRATYDRTLSVLDNASTHRINPLMKVKSGLMVGLGETETEVYQTLDDLKDAGCDIVTIGQYLQPHRNKLLVKEFVHPEQFKKYEAYGLNRGIKQMFCGPFVRSSYHADEFK